MVKKTQEKKDPAKIRKMPQVIWLSEQEMAEHIGMHRQTLANWRARDRAAGRSSAAPGQPQYQYFGRSVRYKIPAAEGAR